MPPPSNICPPAPGIVTVVAGPPPKPLPLETAVPPPAAPAATTAPTDPSGLSPELAAALAAASEAADAAVPPPVKTPVLPPAMPVPATATPAQADEPPPVMLDEIVFDWIAVNRKPEDVFSREALVAWAHDNGFCTKEEVVKAIVENLLPRKL